MLQSLSPALEGHNLSHLTYACLSSLAGSSPRAIDVRIIPSAALRNSGLDADAGLMHYQAAGSSHAWDAWEYGFATPSPSAPMPQGGHPSRPHTAHVAQQPVDVLEWEESGAELPELVGGGDVCLERLAPQINKRPPKKGNHQTNKAPNC